MKMMTTSGHREDETHVRSTERDPSSTPPTLLQLTTVGVAVSADLDQIAPQFDFFPTAVRHLLLHHLQDGRLRRLECLLWAATHPHPTGSGSYTIVGYEADFQAEWRRRCKAAGLHVDAVVSSESLFRETATPRNARRLYLQHLFRNLLRSDAAATTVAFSGDSHEPQQQPQHLAMALFVDVVVALKVNARELTPANVPRLLQLPLLRRLELHHLSDHHKNSIVPCLESVLTRAPSLEEVCFFHGRLSGQFLQCVAHAITKRHTPCESSLSGQLKPLKTIEFVSVKLKNEEDHHHLVELLAICHTLDSVRISSTISDFDNHRLVETLLALPTLQQLSLEHNDLDDAAFAGIFAPLAMASHVHHRPSTTSPLRHFRLGSNAITATTVQMLARATVDGLLALEKLELRNNHDIRDTGIQALLPMLRIPSLLTHLDIRNCHFGLDGAAVLLRALAANECLLSLDMSQNFFGSGIGDLLADCLLTNHTLERVHLSYVGLGAVGCSERLQLALRTNQSLRVFSVGANRLRDQGALALVRAIARRSRTIPYSAVDLSGNLLTVDCLRGVAKILAHAAGAAAVGAVDDDDDDDDEEEDEENDDEDGDEDGDLVEGPAVKRRRLLAVHRPTLTPTSTPVKNPTQSTVLIHELGVLNNDLGSRGDTAAQTQDVLEELRQYVGTVHSNEWSARRHNVYDDEV